MAHRTRPSARDSRGPRPGQRSRTVTLSITIDGLRNSSPGSFFHRHRRQSRSCQSRKPTRRNHSTAMRRRLPVRGALAGTFALVAAMLPSGVRGGWSRLWEEITSRPQAPKRAAHVLVTFNDSLYVYGGIGDTAFEEDREYDDTWRFDLLAREWTQVINANTPRPGKRFHAAGALHSNASVDEMVVFGGLMVNTTAPQALGIEDDYPIEQYNEIWRLRLNRGQEAWTKDPMPINASVAPAPRSEAGVAILQDRLFVYGGISYDEQSTTHTPKDYGDLWVYDLVACTWSHIEPADGFVPPERFSHAFGAFEDHDGEPYLFTFSGRHLASSTWSLLGDAWIFSLSRRTWIKIELSAAIQRAYTPIVLIDPASTSAAGDKDPQKATKGAPVTTNMWFFGGYYRPAKGVNGYVYDDTVSGALSLSRAANDALVGSMTLSRAIIDDNEAVPPLRYNHKAALWRNCLVIHGGSYQTQRSDVWLFNTTEATLRVETSTTIPLDVQTLIYILAAFIISIIVVLVLLIIRWRRIDRRNLELARARGVAIMRGISKERLDQMAVTKYKRPPKAASPTPPPVQDDRDEPSSSEEVCPICLIEFEDDEDVRNLPCRHLFHVACIDEWLNRNTTCPMCKNNLDLEVVDVGAVSPTMPTPPPARTGGAVVTPVLSGPT